jgi:hypothetical protein
VFYTTCELFGRTFCACPSDHKACWGGFDPSSIAELEANFSVINEVTSGRTALGESFIGG